MPEGKLPVEQERPLWGVPVCALRLTKCRTSLSCALVLRLRIPLIRLAIMLDKSGDFCYHSRRSQNKSIFGEPNAFG